MRNRSFAQQDDSAGAIPSDNSGDPEYVFEGFKVELSEKVMLTPLAADKKM